MVDVPLGTGNTQSGWTTATGDTTYTDLGITGEPFNTSAFTPAAGLNAVLPSAAPSDFPLVGAALMETREQIKETGQQLKESQVRFDREMQESRASFDHEMKESNREFNKRFGNFFNRFGEMLEYMILPNMVTKFEELGFTFTKANRTEIKDREHEIFLEIDALLENGDTVMAVEIKNKPSIDDINDHVEHIEKLRKHADLHNYNDQRIYLGAIARVVFSGSNQIPRPKGQGMLFL